MKTTELKNANEWFKIHDIPTSILMGKKGHSLYIDIGNFELQLAEEEIQYRANEYIRLKENNLLTKTK